MSTLSKRHAGRPILTNAAINRQHAITCFEAGMSPAEIAAAWPEVFKTTVEHGATLLGLRYDFELADHSGRYETTRTITLTSLNDVLARFKAAKG